jgi:hypothetical protein
LTNPFSLIPHPCSRLSPIQAGQGFLIFGSAMRPLTAAAAAWGVARGWRVFVVDGANRFDPYQLAREGRKRGLRPEQVLSQVWVARAFTCHQLVQLVQEGLPAELVGVEKALVILLGPCSLFYDEQVPLAERRRLFRSLMGGLAQIKQRAALWFLQPSLPPQVANQHFGRLLARLADQVVRVGAGEGRERGRLRAGHRAQLVRPAAG